jgi:hypothetical protein
MPRCKVRLRGTIFAETSASGLIHILHYESLATEIGLFTIAPVARLRPPSLNTASADAPTLNSRDYGDFGTIIERLGALPSDEFLSRPKLSTRDSFASHQA